MTHEKDCRVCQLQYPWPLPVISMRNDLTVDLSEIGPLRPFTDEEKACLRKLLEEHARKD